LNTYDYDWVDAFADRPFGGNGCVVVHSAGDIDTETRMTLVRETSLSECAFIVPSERADFGARYYLAAREILMAGHPTVATVISLVSRGLVDVSGGRAEFSLEVGAGVLPIEVECSANGQVQVTMTQQAPTFHHIHQPKDIATIYGLSSDDIVGIPETVSTGSYFGITVLKDKDALHRAQLDVGALQAYVDSGKGDFTEPFLVTLGGETENGDTFSRLLLPPPMPPEDPFTGSATGCMAAYLWRHGLVENPDFIAEQGHWMHRPGQAKVQVLGPRENISGIRVGGRGYILMSGKLHL